MNKQFRYWGSKEPSRQFPILASTPPGTVDGETALMRIYEPIDSWGGQWGISATEFAQALDSLPSSVSSIDLRVNSPGGEVFDALAILNMLRQHKAEVTVTVDGIAASAASFIAVGAGQTRMAPNSQMMIHDASGVAVGNAHDMTQMAGTLNAISDNIAQVYATSAGGTVEGWRTAMLAESWYSADEAVANGLAAHVVEMDAQPVDRFDLGVFAYSGRDKAPGPVAPTPRLERFTDSLDSVLTELDRVLDRGQEVITFRAAQGKTRLSDRSVEQSEAIKACLERMSALLAGPDNPSTVTDLDRERLELLRRAV